jgi:Xaa-Pro aminopeptidase
VLPGSLSSTDVELLRELGEILAICMTRACFEARPGLSEHQIAGMLAGDLYGFGATPAALLVGTDERAWQFPQPVPTENRLRAHLLLAVTARRRGVVASLTRLVHFGPVPEELRRSHDAVIQCDAACHQATRPGVRVAEILETAHRVRAASGFATDSWDRLDQREPAGHADFADLPLDPDAIVQPNQAFAWSPWLSGTRSEDTLLATPDGPVVVTVTQDLPVVRITLDGAVVERPDILVR